MNPAGAALPQAMIEFFDGDNLETKVGITALLGSASVDGRPHLAMLSAGEILAASAHVLHLGLHKASGSTRALTDNGHGLVSVVLGGVALQAAVIAERVEVDDPSGTDTAYFRAAVSDVKQDQAPYARIVSGVTYELLDAPRTLERWRAKLAVLKTL